MVDELPLGVVCITISPSFLQKFANTSITITAIKHSIILQSIHRNGAVRPRIAYNFNSIRKNANLNLISFELICPSSCGTMFPHQSSLITDFTQTPPFEKRFHVSSLSLPLLLNFLLPLSIFLFHFFFERRK